MLISKRAVFGSGQQKRFIEESRKILGLSNQELSRLLHISDRTLSDWKREKFNISLGIVKIISRKTGRKIPEGIKIIEPFWYVKKGGRIGGIAVYKKYGSIGGDPEKRKQRWFEWWNSKGKFRKNSVIGSSLSIKYPKKSELLAEFVGIVLGDGGISKYQLVITLHRIDDLKYSNFVRKIIFNLFKIRTSKCFRQSVVNIIVSRIRLVKFCVENLGLKIGNKVKQQVDIPKWIKENVKYKKACLRGLIDTDGSIIIHKYKSNGKYYSYQKIGFTSRSIPLLKSVSEILCELKIKHRIMQPYDIRIESRENVEKYFNVVGTHNPKHLKRFKLKV